MMPAGLRLARSSPDLVEAEGRLPREGPLLVAIALSALGLIPLLAPGSLTPLRAAGSLGLFAIAAGLGWSSIGRRQSVTIRPTTGEVSAGDRRCSLNEARAFVLTTVGGARDAEPRLAYRAELELAAGGPVVVLEGADPAVVLTDLRTVLEQVDLPVRSGWGLPKDAEPWRRSPRKASGQPERELTVRAERLPSQRRAAITVLSGAVFTTIAMGVMFGTRLRRGDSVGALSWALALGTITVLYVIGIFIASDHVAIRSDGDRVRIERRSFGRARSVREIRRVDVLAAYGVGPAAEPPRHVLVETESGFVSIACAGDAATAVARALGG